MKTPFFTIGIPTYEMSGKGVLVLEELIDTINEQIFRDFEVIISDHSIDNEIEKFIKSKYFDFNIIYLKKTLNNRNPSSNINNIIKHSKGKYIKFVFQDDLLNGSSSLDILAKKINEHEGSEWFVSGCLHLKNENLINPMVPYFNKNIHLGINTISSPSVLTIRNSVNLLKFNETYVWLLDCIYYKDCFSNFGKPVVINSPLVINRLSKNQLTNKLKESKKLIEIIRSINYYEKNIFKYLLYLKYSLIFCRNVLIAKLRQNA
jgi:glycosyltransferase involved in cell wall biosynthesis